MSTLSPLPAEVSLSDQVQAKQKKTLVRRGAPDRSQGVRRAVQIAFLLLNAAIGVQFILWVRYFETGGTANYFERPAGVDGWLPIAGLMNLRYFLALGKIPPIHPSAMVLLCVFLVASALVKKAFCSWLCPVGTVSEYLWKLGRKVFKRNLMMPKWLDVPLRGLKYLLLAFFVYIVFTMPAMDLGDFLASPFGIIADVKMLNFFRYMGTVGMMVVLVLVTLSVVVQNFWCRFLCPYGALMGIVSALSPVKIRRDAEACPSQLPVDRLVQIRSVECTGCMECIAVCPAENALQMALMPRKEATGAARWRGRVMRPRMVAVVLAVVFFGLIGAARVTGHWQTNLSREVYMQLVPNAENFDH